MTLIEGEILKCLQDIEAGVAAMRGGGPKPNLLPLFSRLEKLADGLAAESHRDLIHYVHNGSYQKARLWLEQRDSENARSTCGGRA